MYWLSGTGHGIDTVKSKIIQFVQPAWRRWCQNRSNTEITCVHSIWTGRLPSQSRNRAHPVDDHHPWTCIGSMATIGLGPALKHSVLLPSLSKFLVQKEIWRIIEFMEHNQSWIDQFKVYVFQWKNKSLNRFQKYYTNRYTGFITVI